jgi:hypothetical protein
LSELGRGQRDLIGTNNHRPSCPLSLSLSLCLSTGGGNGRRGEKNPEDRIVSLEGACIAYGLRDRPSLLCETEKAFRTKSLRVWDSRSPFPTKPLRRERRDRREATPRNLISRRWPASPWIQDKRGRDSSVAHGDQTKFRKCLVWRSKVGSGRDGGRVQTSQWRHISFEVEREGLELP